MEKNMTDFVLYYVLPNVVLFGSIFFVSKLFEKLVMKLINIAAK